MRSGRDVLRLWFSLRVPVAPRDYLVHGVTLMVAKYLVDATVIGLAGHVFWSPIDYLLPSIIWRESRLQLSPTVEIALGLWTLPFIWIGASMSVRRAVDAGRPAWTGLLFFVPIVNYVMMIVLCFLPSRATAAPTVAPETPASSHGEPMIDRNIRSALLGLGVGVLISFPLGLLCTVVFRNAGFAAFFGTPFVASVATGFLHNQNETRPVGETVLVATLGLAIVAGAFLLFAVEGVVCVAMAFPLAVPIAWMGSLFGRDFARRGREQMAHAAWLVLALPPLAALESRLPAPPPTCEVVSSVVVAAPPEVVWRHVVSFDELPPPRELLFRLGVAYPERATIRGSGVGAMRRCEFSTGAFVEPITAWDEPRRLSFDVVQQPDPMRELSPYRHVVAPHMADGFRAVRGEFRLTPLPGGRTRLEGSTWYRLRLRPRSYWSLWADAFVETIHLRVLEHIRRESEAAYGASGGRANGASPDESVTPQRRIATARSRPSLPRPAHG
jgi:uncharacterized membrane protein YhaH (DUF805 family)